MVKTKDNQLKAAKIKTYKKNTASVMTSEALLEVVEKRMFLRYCSTALEVFS